jgi:hypothetical protein
VPLQPDAIRGEKRIFSRFRNAPNRKDDTVFSQETDETLRSPSTVREPCPSRQYAALAADRTAAVMLGEPLENDVVDIAPTNPRQTKPVGEMFGFSAVSALNY